jgi:hypothetical protein
VPVNTEVICPIPTTPGFPVRLVTSAGSGLRAQNSPAPAEARTPGATRKSVRTEAGASRGHCRSSGAHPSSQGRQCARRQPGNSRRQPTDNHRAETRRR